MLISTWIYIIDTFDEAIISLDEAKNLCIAELRKYFLTKYNGKRVRHKVSIICIQVLKLLYTFFAQIRFQAKGEETHKEGGVFLIFSEKNQKNTSLSKLTFFSGMKTSLFQKVYSNLMR